MKLAVLMFLALFGVMFPKLVASVLLLVALAVVLVGGGALWLSLLFAPPRRH